MDKNQDEVVRLTDVPAGATVDLVGWGDLSQADIRKLTDVGIYLDLPLTVTNVTLSGPVVVAVSDAHVAIGLPVARQLQVIWNKKGEE